MHLFRAFSDQSHGMNTERLIAPGAAQLVRSPSHYHAPAHTETGIGAKLLNELAWKTETPSILTNWTPSLQLAIVVAQYRMREKETNVRILCIEMSEARNLDGKVSKFHSVPFLLALHGVEIRTCADGTPFKYDDVFVALDCVVPGQGTRIARLETLESNGLYSLYPGMAEYYSWNNPRSKLNVTLQSRRKFHCSARQCTTGTINVAAKVAATFLPTRNAKLDSIPTNILGAVIALQKRPYRDRILHDWLNEHATEVVSVEDNADQGDTIFDDALTTILRSVPDVEQYLELRPILANRTIKLSALLEIEGISEAEERAARQEWKTWSDVQRSQRRAEKAGRPDFASSGSSRPRRNQKERRHSGLNERKQTDRYERRRGRGNRERTNDHGRNGRRKRDWLAVEGYDTERAEEAEYKSDRAETGLLGFAMPGFESSVFQTESQREQRPSKKAKNVMTLD